MTCTVTIKYARSSNSIISLHFPKDNNLCTNNENTFRCFRRKSPTPFPVQLFALCHGQFHTGQRGEVLRLERDLVEQFAARFADIQPLALPTPAPTRMGLHLNHSLVNCTSSHIHHILTSPPSASACDQPGCWTERMSCLTCRRHVAPPLNASACA